MLVTRFTALPLFFFILVVILLHFYSRDLDRHSLKIQRAQAPDAIGLPKAKIKQYNERSRGVVREKRRGKCSKQQY